MGEKTKTCSSCRSSKKLKEFRSQQKSPDGLQHMCKACQTDYALGLTEDVNRLDLPPDQRWPMEMITCTGCGQEFEHRHITGTRPERCQRCVARSGKPKDSNSIRDRSAPGLYITTPNGMSCKLAASVPIRWAGMGTFKTEIGEIVRLKMGTQRDVWDAQHGERAKAWQLGSDGLQNS